MAPRNRLLAVAAGVAAVALVLDLVATILLVTDTGLKTQFVFDLLAAIAIVVAFVVAGAGFRVAAATARARILTLSAALFGVYGTATLVSAAIKAGGNVSGTPWQISAAQVANAAGGGFLLLVALFLIAAFVARRSNGLFGWACVPLATHFVCVAAAYSFELSALTPITGVPGGITGGLGTIAGGDAVLVVAAVFATLAFFSAAGYERLGQRSASLREGLLGVAASVFAAGFLIAAVGTMVFAASDNGAKIVAEDWLEAFEQFGLFVAAVCGAIAFSRSGRVAEASAPAAGSVAAS